MGRAEFFQIAAGLAIIAACATPATHNAEAPRESDCFNVSMVTDYETMDRDTVRLDVGPGHDYDVDLEGGQCNTVEWSHTLALQPSSSSWVCVGDRVGQGEIRFRDPDTRRRISCQIGDVRRVEEASAS